MTRHLKRAEAQIVNNKGIELVRNSLALHYEEVHKAEFNQSVMEEYYTLYPIYRDMTDEEREEYINDNFMDRDGELDYNGEELPQIEIDYSEDENYITLEDYINETRVVVEAVEGEYDEDGLVIVEPVAEVTEMVRPFVPKDNYDEEIDAYLDSSELYAKRVKVDKEKVKAQLVVEHNTVPYDADSGSINYMSATIAVANFKFIQALAQDPDLAPIYDAIYKETTGWKNAENEVSEVQFESIGEALHKSMLEVGSIIGVEGE